MCWSFLPAPSPLAFWARRQAQSEPDADCVVRGPASDIYQLLWNRRDRDGLAVEGDATVLDLFASSAQVRWS